MKKLVFILSLLPVLLFADRKLSVFVGDTFNFSYSLKYTNLQKLSVEIEIDNPSLLLPQFIITENDTTEIVAKSKFLFSADDININKSDSLLFTVSGLILAGNDTIANAKVSFIINDNFEINDNVNFKILNYAPMPYIRFPDVINLYPNPVTDGESIDVIFQLDEDSEVIIQIFSITGKLIYEKLYEFLTKGEIKQSLSIENIESYGVYILMIKTENTISLEKFTVIK